MGFGLKRLGDGVVALGLQGMFVNFLAGVGVYIRSTNQDDTDGTSSIIMPVLVVRSCFIFFQTLILSYNFVMFTFPYMS